MNWKQQSITLSVFIAGIMVGALCNDYTHTSKWADQQLKLSEVDFTRPTITYAKVEIQTNATPKEQHNANVLRIAEIIRKKESGNGTAGLAVTCKKLGKSNEYGYNVPFCYDSHEELTEIIHNWIERKLERYTLEEAMCLYNTGNATKGCTYWQDFNRYYTSATH